LGPEQAEFRRPRPLVVAVKMENLHEPTFFCKLRNFLYLRYP
jgi:hypothetical protein